MLEAKNFLFRLHKFILNGFKMNPNMELEKLCQKDIITPSQCYSKMSIRQKNILNHKRIKKKQLTQKMLTNKNLSTFKPQKHFEKLKPVTSDEVVKLEKHSEDTDYDIDIEEANFSDNIKATSINSRSIIDVSDPVQSITNFGNVPLEEYVFYDKFTITDNEKNYLHEFFENRPSKTPERYLKIRNHILDCWENCKPKYLTKLLARKNLKNCGDVNSIGNIHTYLEQIGAINFGCKHINYIRPLDSIFASNEKCNRLNKQFSNKCSKNENIKCHQNSNTSSPIPRQKRNKRFIKFNGDEGGYTFMHDETGDIIETTLINRNEQHMPRKHRKPNIKLISCRPFTENTPAPYIVKIDISALLHMDWHAHSSFDEVIGLIGGIYDQHLNILKIKRYVPCETITNSHVHCDMCPISQSLAQESILNDNLQVIGWFHTHPTFSANPSDQDIETQLNMQKWLERSSYNDLPLFVGIILSPFTFYKNSTHISDYQCILIRSEPDANGQQIPIPYKFQTSIMSSDINVEQLIQNLKLLYNEHKKNEIDLSSSYIFDTTITNLDKMLISTKSLLSKYCENIGDTNEKIIKEIQNLGSRKSK